MPFIQARRETGSTGQEILSMSRAELNNLNAIGMQTRDLDYLNRKYIFQANLTL